MSDTFRHCATEAFAREAPRLVLCPHHCADLSNIALFPHFTVPLTETLPGIAPELLA